MPGERQTPHIDRAKSSSVVTEIFHQLPTGEDKKIIGEKRKEIVKESDIGGVVLYKELRTQLQELDTDNGWKETKEKARLELADVSPDVLAQLLKKFSPFIKNLPAGHGKGHLFRDAIHLTGMLQNPEYTQKPLDEVELFTGIIAGMFHDIGNSVVDRYEDAQRLGAHAEVGAVLFGNEAKGVLPPHLTKLAQYAIAAHTHYSPGQEVMLSNGSKEKRQDYNDSVSDEGDRLSLWLTRQTDRRDTSNLAFLFRNYLLRTKPIRDFDGKAFDELKGQEENFKIQYSVDPEYVNQKGVISHCVNFAKNVFDSKVPYTKQDTAFFTRQLMTPGLVDFALFLDIVAPSKKEEMIEGIEKNESEAMKGNKWRVNEGEMTSSQIIKTQLEKNKEFLDQVKSQSLTPELIQVCIENFITVAQTIEPAADLKALTNSLRLQYLGGEIERNGKKEHVGPLLSPEAQEKLARGFYALTGPLRENWLNRLGKEIEHDPHLGKKIRSHDEKTQSVLENLGKSLQSIAHQELKQMGLPQQKLQD